MAIQLGLVRCEMAKLVRTIGKLYPSLSIGQKHMISTTTVNHLKEIREKVEDKVTTVEGVYVESPRKNVLLPVDTKAGCCYLCKLNLDIQHTDVLILSQFVNKDGKVLSQRVTGLCGTQQKVVESLVTQAFQAGLMPNLNPTRTYEDPRERPKHQQHNRYFEGETLKDKVHEFR